MIVGGPKHLKRDAVMQVFTGVNFVANIDAQRINGVIQNGPPTFVIHQMRPLQTGGAL
jgi:hypothetical protein